MHVPWGIAFLPGEDALVTERTTGRIVRVAADGSGQRAVMAVPGVDTGAGEGGLLGLALSPDYARDRLVHAYYTTARAPARRRPPVSPRGAGAARRASPPRP